MVAFVVGEATRLLALLEDAALVILAVELGMTELEVLTGAALVVVGAQLRPKPE